MQPIGSFMHSPENAIMSYLGYDLLLAALALLALGALLLLGNELYLSQFRHQHGLSARSHSRAGAWLRRVATPNRRRSSAGR